MIKQSPARAKLTQDGQAHRVVCHAVVVHETGAGDGLAEVFAEGGIAWVSRRGLLNQGYCGRPMRMSEPCSIS